MCNGNCKNCQGCCGNCQGCAGCHKELGESKSFEMTKAQLVNFTSTLNSLGLLSSVIQSIAIPVKLGILEAEEIVDLLIDITTDIQEESKHAIEEANLDYDEVVGCSVSEFVNHVVIKEEK